MEASAPFMKLCTTCNEPIDDNDINQSIRYSQIKFGSNEDFKAYLTKYQRSPDSIDECIPCAARKWQTKKTESINNEKRSQAQKKSLKNESKISSVLVNLVLLIVAMLLGSTLFWFQSHNNSENKSMISEDILKSTITKLEDQFPSMQRGLLKKIRGAFLRLKSPGEPFVLLLLHDDTNKKTTDCLASYTSIVAKQNIFTHTPQSLWMNASEWAPYSDSDDSDVLQEKLIPSLKKNEVLVLENLQDLPWSLANAFHYLCDSENPQIDKAMYILELKVTEDNLNQLSDVEKIEVAERAMSTAWKNATNSFRAALISRLTSYVDAVLLKSDEECSNNKLQPMQSEIYFIKISP